MISNKIYILFQYSACFSFYFLIILFRLHPLSPSFPPFSFINWHWNWILIVWPYFKLCWYKLPLSKFYSSLSKSKWLREALYISYRSNFLIIRFIVIYTCSIKRLHILLPLSSFVVNTMYTRRWSRKLIIQCRFWSYLSKVFNYFLFILEILLISQRLNIINIFNSNCFSLIRTRLFNYFH